MVLKALETMEQGDRNLVVQELLDLLQNNEFKDSTWAKSDQKRFKKELEKFRWCRRLLGILETKIKE